MNKQERLRLLSHRLNGFDHRSATKKGLIHALELGVKWIEIDTRHTADDEVIIDHDPDLRPLISSDKRICDLTWPQIQSMLPVGENLMTLEECLQTFQEHNRYGSILCLDIKDTGFEKQYVEAIRKYRLTKQVCIVSWLPQVLRRIHAIEPSIPLIFSHISCGYSRFHFFISKLIYKHFQLWKWMGAIGRLIGNLDWEKRKYRDVHFSNPNKCEHEIVGMDCEFFVFGSIHGQLERDLIASHGAVCLPADNVTRDLVNHYHRRGIAVWVFNINDEAEIVRYIDKFNPDLIFCDNATLFN